VVVTGLGLCAPVSFEEVLQGGCGLISPTEWEIPEAAVRVGQVREDVSAGVRELPGGWRPDRLDPLSHFALLAAHQARLDSGLTGPADMEEAAVVLSSAMAGLKTISEVNHRVVEHALTGKKVRLTPYGVPKMMPNAASANVAILLGAHGANFSPAAACASGAYGIALAADLLRAGRADVAVAGGVDAPCVEFVVRSFLAGNAVSPTGQLLPFHRDRDGFVIAEGAAVLVLEELQHARARGARIYAELAGTGLTCDAYHIAAPHPEASYSASAIRLALREACLAPDQIDYINAHATGTPLGDVSECHAIRQVFGTRLPLVSSTKGATGHLQGAAGALEAVFAVLALHSGRVPPTRGLDASGADPECAAGGIDFVPDLGREAPLRAVLSNSFAFGGHNACLAFSRYD
jgi:3-oxoacyl-[acyl-carrier-protein] synthase II